MSDPAVLGVAFLGVADRRGPGWAILGLPAWWWMIDRQASRDKTSTLCVCVCE